MSYIDQDCITYKGIILKMHEKLQNLFLLKFILQLSF